MISIDFSRSFTKGANKLMPLLDKQLSSPTTLQRQESKGGSQTSGLGRQADISLARNATSNDEGKTSNSEEGTEKKGTTETTHVRLNIDSVQNISQINYANKSQQDSNIRPFRIRTQVHKKRARIYKSRPPTSSTLCSLWLLFTSASREDKSQAPTFLI